MSASPHGTSSDAPSIRVRSRVLALLAAGALVAACGGSSGGDDGGGGGNEEPDPPAEPSDNVTIGGAVTFDFVPSRVGEGLVYADTEPRPVRAATVEAVATTGDDVLATATTDTAGAYALDVPAGTTVFLRVRAEMIRDGTPGWDVRVVDNTEEDAPYVLDGDPFDTGDADSTRDLHAPSGWTGASYGNVRSAAPFAMLDTVYESMQLTLGIESGLTFPPLVVHWSEGNVPTEGDISEGEIGGSFYSGGGIYILGAEDVDTDEYDPHVVAHEWGHYFEDFFSRGDTIGGPHRFGDLLDLRTAFGEAFASVLSGVVTGSSLFHDAADEGQAGSFGFDLEGSPGLPPGANTNPGWFSEQSVQEMLWDLYDTPVDGADTTLALGFEPLYSIMTGPQASTLALTSVFSFFTALKQAHSGDSVAIDALTSANDIEPVQDAYGTDEDNSGGAGNVIPVYLPLTVNGGPVSDVCSTDAFGAENKLGSRRFLRFSVNTAGLHAIMVTTTDQPAGASADPDFLVHRAGPVAFSRGPPSDTCTSATPEQCVETQTVPLQTGVHVLEVYEWTNTNEPGHEEFPPIGPTCFDVEVTRP